MVTAVSPVVGLSTSPVIDKTRIHHRKRRGRRSGERETWRGEATEREEGGRKGEGCRRRRGEGRAEGEEGRGMRAREGGKSRVGSDTVQSVFKIPSISTVQFQMR